MEGFFMGERIDDLFERLGKMEDVIIGRLSDQDVRLARMEEGQKAIHRRIDDHMSMEELQRKNDHERAAANFQRLQESINGIREELRKIEGEEAKNTSLRNWSLRLYRSFLHFVQWAFAAGIFYGLWGYLQTMRIV